MIDWEYSSQGISSDEEFFNNNTNIKNKNIENYLNFIKENM